MKCSVSRTSVVWFTLCALVCLQVFRARGEDALLHVSTFPLAIGSASWGDYDNDGWLDLAVTGLTSNNVATTQIWYNKGDGTFSNAFTLGPRLLGDATWADLDNDGFVDLVITGRANPTNDVGLGTDIWQNHGGTNFEQIPNILPASRYSTIAIGDFDNDGRPDIVVYGSNDAASGRIYRNLGGFSFTTNGTPSFPPAGTASLSRLARFADVDNDGWLDLLAATNSRTPIYRNLNGVNFTNFDNLDMANLRGDFADYNNDGRLDLFAAAVTARGGDAFVWFNTGAGFVTNTTDFSVISVDSSSASQSPAPAASWGDVDNDGRPDIFRAWGIGSTPVVYRNLGNGSFERLNFTNVLNASFVFGDPDNLNSMFGIWGDYDNDGKLDLFKSETDYILSSQTDGLYHNETAISNTPPSAPSGLSIQLSPDGTNVTLHWLAASDAQTPAAGLSYNVRVGTSPGGCDVVSPMADSVTGRRRVVGLGNAQERLFAFLQNLQAGRMYYWSVQAIDSAYAGGAWAPESSFTTKTPPAGDLNGDGIVNASEFNQVLSSYLAGSPYLQMTNPADLGSETVTFALTNDFAGAFTVEYSTNLTDWQPLGLATPRYLFTDPGASNNPQRFYRLRFP